ncbi:MAG: COX15/CtaA family protein [Gammaproteobacteria bacterium]|nr:COX15/CtaA family protein [Gammaproteobacteria bacterium]
MTDLAFAQETRPSVPAPKARSQRAIAIWLLLCCAMIYAMVIVGGITRLTHSGLSIVHWDPIMGAIPPLNMAQWNHVFHLYQQTPEFRDVNSDMDLAQFKTIFWMEYAHRLLGRSIGLVFLLPFLYFLIRGRIEKRLIPKLVTMFILGGLQGALGWYMVSSGLVHNPHVSQYRLTAHLSLAFLIYAYILWVALDLLGPTAPIPAPEFTRLRRFSYGVTALVFLMVIAGGFVAGLRAGFIYNTFPMMNGRWLPLGMFALHPLWRNFFANMGTVQFDHRMIAYLLIIVISSFWFMARRTPLPRRPRIAIHLLLAMLAIQVTLGITTLLLVVPTPLASAHQAGALMLFTIAVFTSHAMRNAQPTTA